MAIFYSQDSRIRHSAASWLRIAARRAIGGIGAGLRAFHRAIVAAKTRRMQRGLTSHNGLRDDGLLRSDSHDAAKFPQPPLILGDKWDF